MPTQTTASIGLGPIDNNFGAQIADLLNRYSNLKSSYTARRITHSTAHYFPLSYNGMVLGAVAIQKNTQLLTEIKHLVIHPAFRGQGLAKQLVGVAISHTNTPLIYATIWKDNAPSLATFRSFGFRKSAETTSGDHVLVLMLRERKLSAKSKGHGQASRPAL